MSRPEVNASPVVSLKKEELVHACNTFQVRQVNSEHNKMVVKDVDQLFDGNVTYMPNPSGD